MHINPYRRKFLNKLIWACAASALSPLNTLKATGKKNSNQSISLIIDADTANEVDDAFAIARALVEPRFNIKGLCSAQWHTQANAPNDSVGRSQQMNEDLLALMGKSAIPHPMGSNTPMVSQLRAQPSPAASLIINEAHKMPSGEKLTVLTLGPATNVASAILIDPSILPKLKCCYLGLWYNIKDQTWNKREFNSDNDPNALDVLLNTQNLELEIMTATTSKALVFEKKQVNNHFKGKGEVFDYLITLWDNYDRFWQEKDPEKKYWIMWDVALIEALAKPNLCQKKKVITPHDNFKRDIVIYSKIDEEAMEADFWASFGD
tara:strand:- start:668 stop:1627 length:960 start_codon:yes stop_codon:yes gene_type:complete